MLKEFLKNPTDEKIVAQCIVYDTVTYFENMKKCENNVSGAVENRAKKQGVRLKKKIITVKGRKRPVPDINVKTMQDGNDMYVFAYGIIVSDIISCPSCGFERETDKEWVFCPECGEKIK